jgi:hypothetical protein
VEVVNRLARLGPYLVLDRDRPCYGAVDDHVEDRASLSIPFRRDWQRIEISLGQQPGSADCDVVALDDGLCTAAGKGSEPCRRRDVQATRRRTRRDRPRDGMLGVALDCRGQSEDLTVGRVHQCRRPPG